MPLTLFSLHYDKTTKDNFSTELPQLQQIIKYMKPHIYSRYCSQLVGKLLLQRLILNRIKSHFVDKRTENLLGVAFTDCILLIEERKCSSSENIFFRFSPLGIVKSKIFRESICFVRNGYFRLNVYV